MNLCVIHNRLRCGECAYIEELKQDNQNLADKYNRDVYALETKVEEMQKTLEWYADEKNWKLGVNISMGSAFPLHEAIKSDKGERARQALKGETNEPSKADS